MAKLIIIGLGGFIGAIGRYMITQYFFQSSTSEFPLGTFIVNILGCLLLGMFMYYAQSSEAISPHMRMFVAIGILGAFTTFSTFSYETVALFNAQKMMLAFANVTGSILLGVFSVWLGYSIIKWVKI